MSRNSSYTFLDFAFKSKRIHEAEYDLVLTEIEEHIEKITRKKQPKRSNLISPAYLRILN